MEDKIISLFLAYTEESDELVQIIKDEIEVINNSLIKVKQLIKILEWKSTAVPAMGNMEDNILRQMPLQECDYVVCLFRFKFGTPTGNINPATGKEYQSGLEEEFCTAYRLWKQNKRPEIIVFKSTEPIPTEYAALKESEKLESFFSGYCKGLYAEYSDPDAFRKLFRRTVLTYLFRDSLERQKALQKPESDNSIVDFFFEKDSSRRNIAKQQDFFNDSVLKLHAKTGLAFLAPKGAHYHFLLQRLNMGKKVKIIIQNPWSYNAVYTMLRKNDFLNAKEYTAYTKNKLDAQRIMEAYENCYWLKNRLKLTIESYKNLRRQFHNLIELRFSDRDLSNSILLTGNYLFFEPYFSMLEEDDKRLTAFEIQFSIHSPLYRETDLYFDRLWESSYTFTTFQKNSSQFKERLRRQMLLVDEMTEK